MIWIISINVNSKLSSKSTGRVRYVLTVALQKAKIISGAGPTLTSGGSLGRFGDCSKELVLSVEQVKAWRPLVEQVRGEIPTKNQNFSIMGITWVVTRWQSTLWGESHVLDHVDSRERDTGGAGRLPEVADKTFAWHLYYILYYYYIYVKRWKVSFNTGTMLKARQVGTTAPLPERWGWISPPKLLFLSVLGVLGWLVIFNKFGFGWVSSLDLRLDGYLQQI